MTIEVLLSLITEKGFEKTGDYYTYLLQGEELQDYFSLDSDTTDLIESGQVKAAVLEVYPEQKKVNYILFEETPSEEDVASATILHEDDFDGFMEWLQG